MAYLSARQNGQQACLACGQIAPLDQRLCARCQAPLHSREHHSVQRAWAWLLAGMVLYVPANLYPIMTTGVLGQNTANTILGGVDALIRHHAYLVAAVVFIASILIPILKFIAMIYLLLVIGGQRIHATRQQEHLRLYRLVEWVGRWSMIDIFVVAILAALVQFGGLAQITPGPGADAFAAVVVCTMLSAHALDPRLIWDGTRENTRPPTE